MDWQDGTKDWSDGHKGGTYSTIRERMPPHCPGKLPVRLLFESCKICRLTSDPRRLAVYLQSCISITSWSEQICSRACRRWNFSAGCKRRNGHVFFDLPGWDTRYVDSKQSSIASASIMKEGRKGVRFASQRPSNLSWSAKCRDDIFSSIITIILVNQQVLTSVHS